MFGNWSHTRVLAGSVAVVQGLALTVGAASSR